MFYIYSTLTNGTDYAVYSDSKNQDIPVVRKMISIKGGANLANKVLMTPKGAVTEVSDEEMEMLLKDYHFQNHVKHGHITYEKKEISVDKAVVNMNPKDESAPKTPDDYKNHEVQEDNGAGTKTYKSKSKK